LSQAEESYLEALRLLETFHAHTHPERLASVLLALVARPECAVFVLFVPGWTALRMYGAPVSLLRRWSVPSVRPSLR